MAYCILLVDDSATTRGLIKRTIQLAGLPVGEFLEASHGKEALEVLRSHSVDLILADLHMPEMNGIELAHAVLADPALARVPFAVVSAEPSGAKILELRRAGVKGYIRKPCTPESLREMVLPLMETGHACTVH
jgi:two-component system, chemotaxis family, chemotaxis protein CheY